LRLGQFRLDHAPSLLQAFYLPFCGGDNLIRERCAKRLTPILSLDRKHPVVLPLVPEHDVGPRRTFEQGLNGDGKMGDAHEFPQCQVKAKLTCGSTARTTRRSEGLDQTAILAS
jgi:hypothetical protein